MYIVIVIGILTFMIDRKILTCSPCRPLPFNSRGIIVNLVFRRKIQSLLIVIQIYTHTQKQGWLRQRSRIQLAVDLATSLPYCPRTATTLPGISSCPTTG